MSKRDRYVEEARIRLKEMRLLGWSENKEQHRLSDSATLNRGVLDAKTAAWWVIDDNLYSYIYVSPEEALADWLEGRGEFRQSVADHE